MVSLTRESGSQRLINERDNSLEEIFCKGEQRNRSTAGEGM
jgi:hypothetical protein